jgi:hypothetical protein
VCGQGAGGVRDLRQLGAVQRAVGDHTQHPARRQQRFHLFGGTAQPLERPVPAVTHPADRAAHRVPPVLGRPGVADLDRRDRRALRIGDDHGAVQRVVQVQPGGHLGGDLQGDRYRPEGAVGQLAGAPQRGQVGPAEKAGERCVRAGQQEVEVREFVRARRVRRCVTQHVLGQHRTVHRDIPLQPTGGQFLSRAGAGRAGLAPMCRVFDKSDFKSNTGQL